MPKCLTPLFIAACAWLRSSAAQQNNAIEGSATIVWAQVCKGSSSGFCRFDDDEEAASVSFLQERAHAVSSPKRSTDSEATGRGQLIEGIVPLRLLSEPHSKDNSSFKLPADASLVYPSPGSSEVDRLGRIVEMMADAVVMEASPARVDPLSSFPTSKARSLPTSVVEAIMLFSYLCCALYCICIVTDLGKLLMYSKASTTGSVRHKPDDRLVGRASPAQSGSTIRSPRKEPWSILGIWFLCFYRLYTGFLSATWLPYVLAMEGGVLWPENQSLFMGSCKLIYGVTVLANPLCGLLGDKMAEISRGAARRLWILFGIVMSAAGIMICLYAGPANRFWYYMFGISLWRIGEALNDVTSEAIVPEMVPQEQFEIASAVKAASFLVGGLAGYSMVFIYAHLHYSWCYYAYLVSMFLTAIPPLLMLSDDSPLEPTDRSSVSVWKQIVACYTTPMSYDGGFPECCLAIFTTACGTAPFFFTLLILRDLINVRNIVTLQRYFAITCLTFFISAAMLASYDVVFGARAGPNGRQVQEDVNSYKWQEQKSKKLDTLVNCCLLFALIVAIIPSTVLTPQGYRFAAFFVLTVCFGGLYGFGLSRTQDATWRLLPREVDMANAMGFNVMCRNFGLGVGNFVAGVVLDRFQLPGTSATTSLDDFNNATEEQVYSVLGYVVMCLLCAMCNVASARLVRDIKFKHVKLIAMPDEAG